MSKSLLEKAAAATKLSGREAEEVMEALLSGGVETPEVVRLLTALNARPYRAEELAGFARAMRRHAAAAFGPEDERPERMIDTCGTGGDGVNTFNISTAAAIVAAAAGARVAKHGNRAASSRSGSADVLEALGVRIEIPVRRAGRGIREVGIGFLYAQTAHTSMRHVMPARREIRVRTIFNLLGPMTNPAGAETQLLGVFSDAAVTLVAETLADLGVHRAFVVHGAGGLDEISLAGATRVAEVRDGRVREYEVRPGDFGVREAPVGAVAGGEAAENAQIVLGVLRGGVGPKADIVVVNAAAALVAAGVASDWREGAELARAALRSGAGAERLAALVRFTNETD